MDHQEGSWRPLEVPWEALGHFLGAPRGFLKPSWTPMKRPKAPLERAWRAPGTFLAAFEEPTVSFMNIIDFEVFFVDFHDIVFSGPGSCSGGFRMLLEASLKPLEDS